MAHTITHMNRPAGPGSRGDDRCQARMGGAGLGGQGGSPEAGCHRSAASPAGLAGQWWWLGWSGVR